MPLHISSTYTCDDTRGCVMQFWPPDDEHMVLEICRGMKLTYCKTKILFIKLFNYWDKYSAFNLLYYKILSRCTVNWVYIYIYIYIYMGLILRGLKFFNYFVAMDILFCSFTPRITTLVAVSQQWWWKYIFIFF